MLLEKAFSEVFKKGFYIFISHKHKEENHVLRLKNVLERYGFEGYVDWEDDEMPLTTSDETALKLKDRIQKAKKFIFIATEVQLN